MKFPLPDHILRLISKEERAKLGKAGQTWDETLQVGIAKNERELHKLIRNLLGLHGIEYAESRMDKATTQKLGLPDFLFCIQSSAHPWGIAIAWECKMPGQKLTREQELMFVRLATPPNAWNCRIIYCIEDALMELTKLGLLGSGSASQTPLALP